MQACRVFRSRCHPHSQPSLQSGMYLVADSYKWKNAVLTLGSTANRSLAADSETSPYEGRSNSTGTGDLDTGCAWREGNPIPSIHLSNITRECKGFYRGRA